MAQSENIRTKLANVAKSNFPDSEVFLYGSHARGDSHKNSDWDILILLNLPSINFSTETALMDAYYDLELETGEVISPIIYSKSEWLGKRSETPLFKSIEREGIQLK